MLLYAMYVWLRKSRRGPLEAQRKLACMVLLTIVSLIFLQSGRHVEAFDAWVQLTTAATQKGRSPPAPVLRSAHAPSP